MSIVKHNTHDHAGTFADVWNTLLGGGDSLGTATRVNIQETEADFEIQVEAPGREKGDFELTLENGVLRVAAEAKSTSNEEGSRYKLREFRQHKFSRAFRMPKNVDADLAEATYEQGILRITLPKVEMAKAKTLEVK